MFASICGCVSPPMVPAVTVWSLPRKIIGTKVCGGRLPAW